MDQLDHIVWATNDPSKVGDWVYAQSGVRPVHGGVHQGFGTRNDLVGIRGADQYVEFIYPDPDQPHSGTLAEPISKLRMGGLYHWAVRGRDLPEIHAQAEKLGIKSSGVLKASRQTETGALLQWELVFLGDHGFGALMPFFIDWKDCPHPSSTLPDAGALAHFALQTPDPKPLEIALKNLGVGVNIEHAKHSSIHVEMKFEGERVRLPVAEPFTNGFVL